MEKDQIEKIKKVHCNSSDIKLPYLKFNQDYSCFTYGTTKGFHIYSSLPFGLAFHRNVESNIKIIEMYYRTNLLAFVGGGSNPNYPPNKLVLWDDHQMRSISELSFKEEIQAICLRKDKFLVVLMKKIYVYNFLTMKLSDTFTTFNNPLGLCTITPEDNLIILTLGETKGCIKIIHHNESIIEQLAHDSEITALAFSPTTKICATASKRGTLIRLFSTHNGDLLKELRRGSNGATIKSISIDVNDKLLACSSNKGTVHVFSISGIGKKEEVRNTKSKLRFMKWMLSYFGSEWSFAKLKLTDKNTVVALRPDNKLIVISMTGKYYLAEFDPIKGGNCKLIESKLLV